MYPPTDCTPKGRTAVQLQKRPLGAPPPYGPPRVITKKTQLTMGRWSRGHARPVTQIRSTARIWHTERQPPPGWCQKEPMGMGERPVVLFAQACSCARVPFTISIKMPRCCCAVGSGAVLASVPRRPKLHGATRNAVMVAWPWLRRALPPAGAAPATESQCPSRPSPGL